MKILSFLRSPQYMTYATMIWLVSFLFISGSQRHNNFSYLILLLPTLLSLQLSEITRFFKHRLGILLLACIVSLTFADYINAGSPLIQLKFGLIVILFFIAIARLPIIDDASAYKAAWAYLVLIFVYVLFNIVKQHLYDGWELGQRLGELTSKLENVNYVASTMGALLAAITYLGLRKGKLLSIAVANGLVFILSITLLQSRTSILIWIVIAILISVMLYKNDQLAKLIKPLSWVAMIFLLVLAVIYLSPIGDSLANRKLYRTEIWAGYIVETLRCGIWFGCGNEHPFRFVTLDGNIMVHAHNLFLMQFYKSGLVGMISLLGLTLAGLHLAFKDKPWIAWYLCAGLVGLSLDGSTLIHSPSQRWLLFHFPLALLMSQTLKKPKE